jgi:hypothetical protein
VRARKPWRSAFRRTAALPSLAFGPVDFCVAPISFDLFLRCHDVSLQFQGKGQKSDTRLENACKPVISAAAQALLDEPIYRRVVSKFSRFDKAFNSEDYKLSPEAENAEIRAMEFHARLAGIGGYAAHQGGTNNVQVIIQLPDPVPAGEDETVTINVRKWNARSIRRFRPARETAFARRISAQHAPCAA